MLLYVPCHVPCSNFLSGGDFSSFPSQILLLATCLRYYKVLTGGHFAVNILKQARELRAQGQKYHCSSYILIQYTPVITVLSGCLIYIHRYRGVGIPLGKKYCAWFRVSKRLRRRRLLASAWQKKFITCSVMSPVLCTNKVSRCGALEE